MKRSFLLKPCIIALFISLVAASCNRKISDSEYENTYWVTNIRTMNTDGSNDLPLTSRDGYILFANYLPNGQKIVFVETQMLPQDHPANFPQTLYIMDAGGTNITPLLSKSIIPAGGFPPLSTYGGFVPHILFTKDSRQIIFLSEANLYSINVDGSHLVNITNNAGGSAMVESFALSNDDRTIVYSESHYNTEFSNLICTIGIDGSNRKVIKAFKGTASRLPRFLPGDNNTVVYFEDVNETQTILKRVSVTDSAQSSVVTALARSNYYPLLLRSDEMLYFMGDYPNTGLYAIDLHTGAARMFYHYIGAWWVSASPDGSLLASSDDVRFSLLRSNGAVVKDSVQSSSGHIMEPYIAPSNQQVLYRVAKSIQR